MKYWISSMNALCKSQWLPAAFAILMAANLTAQADTARSNSGAKDKEMGVLKIMFQGKPGRALTYSLILPGLGQMYNKSYWKIPIVYAGLGVSGYFIYFNHREYQRYKKAYIERIDLQDNSKDEFKGVLSTSAIKSLRNYHDKNLQISCIAAAVIYLMNGIDAFVDKHLKDFDVSDDLSLRIGPSHIGPGLGLRLVLH